MKPEGLVSPAFPDTFLPSAFHSEVISSLHNKDVETHEAKMGCEWVFRHVDIDRAGTSPWHLTCFRMLVFFESFARTEDDTSLRINTVRTFLNLLKDQGIKATDLLITYFGGGVVLGAQLPPDDEIVSIWTELGVPKKNMIPIAGPTHFTNVIRVGEPAGPRCEIYFVGNNGLAVEIGTVVFENSVLIKNDDSGLHHRPSNRVVFGAAIGIERLVAALGGQESIFELTEFKGITKIVCHRLNIQLTTLLINNIRQLVDGIRSLCIIESSFGYTTIGARKAKLRRLARNVDRACESIGLMQPDSAIHEIASKCFVLEGLIKEPNLAEVLRVIKGH